MEESLKRSRFTSTKCSNYETFKRDGCLNETKSWMGGFDIDKSAVGDYFLDTNDSPPYAKN
nr:unnamed protein product [Callosobruchus analis]